LLCDHKGKTCVVDNNVGQYILFDHKTGDYVDNFSNTKPLKNSRWLNKDRWEIFEKRWVSKGYTYETPSEGTKDE